MKKTSSSYIRIWSRRLRNNFYRIIRSTCQNRTSLNTFLDLLAKAFKFHFSNLRIQLNKKIIVTRVLIKVILHSFFKAISSLKSLVETWSSKHFCVNIKTILKEKLIKLSLVLKKSFKIPKKNLIPPLLSTTLDRINNVSYLGEKQK